MTRFMILMVFCVGCVDATEPSPDAGVIDCLEGSDEEIRAQVIAGLPDGPDRVCGVVVACDGHKVNFCKDGVPQ